MSDDPIFPARPLRRAHRRRVAVWGFMALGIVLAAAVAVSHARHSEPAADATPPFSVSGDHVDVQTGAPTWRYIELAHAALSDPIPPEAVPGRVAFDEARSAPIAAPLQGHVDAVNIRLGQQVRKGERLLAVRSGALVDLLREIESTQAKEAARRAVVERQRALVELKAVPEKDLAAAEQDLRQAHLAHEAAELKLHSLPVMPERDGLYWVTAPREGVVVERNVLVGNEVGPDRAEPLLVVGELDQVIVAADVPEAAVSELRIGQAANVSSAAAPARELAGQIEAIGEVVDPVRRMVNVRVRVPNGERLLRPNAFVQVAFTAQGSARVIVPADAVVTDNEQSFVFVQPPDHQQSLQRRAVVSGRQHEGQVEIVDGLRPGETYVAKGALLLLNAIDLTD